MSGDAHEYTLNKNETNSSVDDRTFLFSIRLSLVRTLFLTKTLPPAGGFFLNWWPCGHACDYSSCRISDYSVVTTALIVAVTKKVVTGSDYQHSRSDESIVITGAVMTVVVLTTVDYY